MLVIRSCGGRGEGLVRAQTCITSRAELFGETPNHPGDSAPLQPRFGAL